MPKVQMTARRRQLLDAIGHGLVGFTEYASCREWFHLAERQPSRREMSALAEYWTDGAERSTRSGMKYHLIELRLQDGVPPTLPPAPPRQPSATGPHGVMDKNEGAI